MLSSRTSSFDSQLNDSTPSTPGKRSLHSPCKLKAMSLPKISPFKSFQKNQEGAKTELNSWNNCNFPPEFLHSYDISEALGEGFQAKVYLVQDKITKKQYAAKVYMTRDPESIERINKELSIVSRMKHVNIAHLSHFLPYEEQGVYIMFYEFTPGLVTLEYYLLNLSPQNWTYEVYQPIIAQILSAMFYCHFNLTVHGDISLCNILVCPVTKYVKIIDFGTSKLISESNNIYSPIGNLDFRPPFEEFLCGDVFAAECWTVGLILLSVVLKQKVNTRKVRGSGKKIWGMFEGLGLKENQLEVLKGLVELNSSERMDLNKAMKMLEIHL